MKKTNLWMGLGLSTLVLLGACADQREALELQGNYQSSSDGEISIRVGGVGCVVNHLNISGLTLSIEQVAYADTDCKEKPLARIVTEGEFDVGAELDIAPNAHELDLKIQKVVITPLHSSWSTIAGIDVSGDCNLGDVEVNTSKVVTGMDCNLIGTFPRKNEIYFTSYALTDDGLNFTKLPHEALNHVGTKEDPAKRNMDLKVHYIRE